MTENRHHRQIEIWTAILMSLTALTTAWSAYQANLWGGSQVMSLAVALEKQSLAAQELLKNNQHRQMDGIISLEIVRALGKGDQKLLDFLIPRVREDFRKPIRDWLALDPTNNPAAPPHPLLMPEYVEQVIKVAANHHAQSVESVKKHMRDANNEGTIQDNYVLLTVLFSVVLFFAGIASTFDSYRAQRLMMVTATLVMIIALLKLFTLSVSP